ncbi:MAG: hypothetical protein WDO69_27375 [Pseudomonadota bacterium]
MFKFHPFMMLAIGCAACGARFSASDGSSGSAGQGQAGEASGGLSSSAGNSGAGDAGEMEVGGTGAAGQSPTAGAGGSVAGSAGATGATGGGTNVGGWWSGIGGNSGADCARLRQEYAAAVDKARVCDKGSTDECSTTSLAPPIGCGCPVLVNAKSESTATAQTAYQAYQDGDCDVGGAVCNVFCAPPMGASCAQQAMAPGNTFVCTGNAFATN